MGEFWLIQCDNKGYILVTVLLVIIILVSLGATFVFSTNFEVRNSLRYSQRLQAYYYARSGAEAARTWLEEEGFFSSEGSLSVNPLKFAGDLNKGLKQVEDFTEQDMIQVKITELSQGSIKVESIGITVTGTLINKETVILNFEAAEALASPFNQAIFAATGSGNSQDPAIKLTGSSKIVGGAGTNSTGFASIQFSWSTGIDDGDLYIGVGVDYNDVIDSAQSPDKHVPDGQIKNQISERNFPTPVFPAMPVIIMDSPSSIELSGGAQYFEINRDSHFEQISIQGNRVLTINFENIEQTIKIRVQDLDISQGHIELINTTADSKVEFYIENSFNLGGSSSINQNGHINNVNVFYKGAADINLSGNQKLFGHVFIENAPLILGGSGNIFGHILSNGERIEVNGNAEANNRILYAPNTPLKLGGSGRVRGAVIALSLIAEGNSRVFFDESFDLENFLFDVIPGGQSALSSAGSSATGSFNKKPVWE